MSEAKQVRELMVSMRHSAGQWMVPGWDGHKVADLLEKVAALLEPVGEGSLLEQARIALGLMLSYHGQGNSDYADVAQVKAQEAYDAIEDAIAASPKSKDQP